MKLIKIIINKTVMAFKKSINAVSRFFYRIRNNNKNFTIISRDCVGGIIYNQLKLKFLTPTINLFFTPDDFNQFCLHLHDYLKGNLVEMIDANTNYPVGLLYPSTDGCYCRPIRINFMHYKTFKDAATKWEERKSRINWDNLFVVSTFCYPIETSTLTNELVNDWNSIEYKKVILVDKKYGFENEQIIDKPIQCKEYAWLLYSPGKVITWRKILNNFDFIKFLNSKDK